LSNGGEKTEQPTPKKIRDSRKKGQVAKSQDLTTAILFFVVFVVLILSMGRNSEILQESMRSYFAQAFEMPAMTPEAAYSLMMGGIKVMFRVIAPILGAGFVVAVAVSFVQVGALFTMEPMKPKLNKLDPIKGFKNKFFSAQTYIEFFKSLFKLTVVGGLLYFVVQRALGDVSLTVRQPISASTALTNKLLASLGTKTGFLLILLGAVDVFIQRWQHTKKLKMSKEEVKREHKESEGDPQYKGQRKRMHQEILAHSAVENVKTADVVVTNPTHIAVAIRYKKDEMGAPQVAAKGERLVAQQIIEIAKKYKIPIMRNIPLAHALNELEEGDEIPEDLYTAVAEVLNWVYSQKQG
jgi:flagellar biosynthetic protein FlhB